MKSGRNAMRVAGIILAAGKGSRLGGGEPKQFRRVGNREMYRHSLERFMEHPGIEDVVLVVPETRLARIRRDFAAWGEKIIVVPGGDTRRKSSRAGIDAVPDGCTHVLIHDAARPWISRDLLNRLVEALREKDAVVPAIDVNDSLLKLNSEGGVVGFPDRGNLRRIQTPQGFRREVIREAHNKAANDYGLAATDDAGMVFYFNLTEMKIIPGEETNRKITSPGDLAAVFPEKARVRGGGIIRRLSLAPLPMEGGYFRETYRLEGESGISATAIYFLLDESDFSELHRLESDEMYHFYGGDPVELVRLFPGGKGDIVVLGSDVERGQTPQCLVPGGVWQGSRLVSGGDYALMGTTMSPGYRPEEYTRGERNDLLTGWPGMAKWINLLIRAE